MPSPASVVALLLPLSLVAACSASEPEEEGADPEPVAQALADGLAAGDLSDVELADPAGVEQQLTEILDGMGDLEPRVELTEVTESDGAATATLGWSWSITEQDWTYTTTAQLSRVDEAWVVEWEPSIVEPSLRRGGALELTGITAARGEIVGAGGQAIVADRPVTRFGIDKSAVSKSRAVESARALAGLLDLDVPSYVERVKASGDEAFVEAIVLRRDEIPVEVGAGYQRIKGALALQDTLPLAPTRDFAAPILGTVGEPTAEMIEEDPDRYAVGQEVGLSGLQLRYDEQLVGTPGVVVNKVASDGKETELFREEAAPGQPLELTLDPRLQGAAERLLAPVGPASALVAIKPSTGAILAAANGPGTDGYNMATFGQFAPGSTFKSVSSLGLLRSGLTPDAGVDCPSTIVVDGKRFKNYDDYPAGGLGTIPFRTALANSCNTAFIGEHDRLGRRTLVDAAASLGMGVDHDLGFPAYFGSVAPTEVGDRGGRGHDRPGHHPRLTDDDGDGRGVDPGRADRAAVPGAVPRGRAGRRPGAHRRRGLAAAGNAARRGDLRQRQPARRRTRPAGPRQDRHRRVRAGRGRAAHPRLDDRRPRRPRRGGLRAGRRLRFTDRRPHPRSLPPRRVTRRVATCVRRVATCVRRVATR